MESRGEGGNQRDASSAGQGLIGCEVGTGLSLASIPVPSGVEAEAWGGRSPRQGTRSGRTPRSQGQGQQGP